MYKPQDENPVKITSAYMAPAGSLDWVYGPNISDKEHQYRRWCYLNPAATHVPTYFAPYFEQQSRHFEANIFKTKVLQDPERHQIVNEIKSSLDEALPGYVDRRKQEHAVADYIEKLVLPLGLLPQAPKLVEKMRSCRMSGVIGVFNGKQQPGREHVVAWDNKCSLSKLCPDEAHAEGKRLAEVYIPPIINFLEIRKQHTIQFCVLTKPNVPLHELHEAKRSMFEDLKKLTKHFPQIKGHLVVQEDPLAIDEKGWNVHLNVIFLVDGFLDWKSLRATWGWNLDIYSEEQMVEKTKASLERKGIDTKSLARKMVLESAFKELAKYTTKLTGGKSHKTFSTHLKHAKPLTEWNPHSFVEWFMANNGFRRTRSYGILYDPYSYRWQRSNKQQKRHYLEKAALGLDQSKQDWKAFDKDERQLLRDAMDGRLYRDLSTVQWLGSLCIGRDYTPRIKLTFIDLIQEDKSRTEYQRLRHMNTHNLAPPEQILKT